MTLTLYYRVSSRGDFACRPETFVVVMTGVHLASSGWTRAVAQHPRMLRMAAPQGMTQARCQLCLGGPCSMRFLPSVLTQDHSLYSLLCVTTVVLTQGSQQAPLFWILQAKLSQLGPLLG